MTNQFINIGDRVDNPSPFRRLLNKGNLVNELYQNQPQLSALVYTDVHCRIDGTRGPYCDARLPQLVNHFSTKSFDLAICSGDMLEGTYSNRGTFAQQTAQYDVLKNGVAALGIPLYHTLGNHDIIGNTDGELLPYFNMPSRYYYVDAAGSNWRFIFLDSMGNGADEHGPFALGATQLAWLTDLIANSSDKNVCLITHVPIMSVAAPGWYIYQAAVNPILAGTFNLTLTQLDVYPLLELCRLNSCIKLCLSGHEHTWDECMYFNTRFLCCGSVCANYWNVENNWHYNYAGYRSINFYANGSISYETFYY